MTILNSQKKRFKLDIDRPLPLAIDQRLQEKKTPSVDLLLSTIILSTVIFWTRMKTYSMGNP